MNGSKTTGKWFNRIHQLFLQKNHLSYYLLIGNSQWPDLFDKRSAVSSLRICFPPGRVILVHGLFLSFFSFFPVIGSVALGLFSDLPDLVAGKNILSSPIQSGPDFNLCRCPGFRSF